MELRGKYGMQKVFTENLEPGAKDQIIELLDQDFIEEPRCALCQMFTRVWVVL